MKGIEIPFGANDSELKGWEYTIPEGMEAEIKDGKIVVREKQSELTPLAQALSNYLKNDFDFFATKKWDEAKWNKVMNIQAAELLELAKKELLSYADESNPAIEAMADLERTYFCNPDKLPKWLKDDIARKELNAHTRGYNKGYNDAEKQYNESVAYHYSTYEPPCFHGGICTNPFKDCINCPRTTGDISTSTTSGTCKKD